MSKEYTEKERREAIIDCAGSYHPAVGGKYLSWKPWLHIRKTYTDEIDNLERRLTIAREALSLALHVQGTSEDTTEVRQRMEDALKQTAPKP